MKDDRVKVLMVCLGNICRSPLAEGILKKKLNPENYLVSSAGTANYHRGKLPDDRSIAVARKYGIDITDQRASQFTKRDFEVYDYIFVMDLENYANVLELASSEVEKSKVKLILNEASPNKNLEVPDPYYGGEKGFENVYMLLDEACNHIASRI